MGLSSFTSNSLHTNRNFNVSGKNITVNCFNSYNVKSLQVSGVTRQDGNGNSSPNNIRAIHGVTKINISGSNNNLQTINLPIELFDGDCYDLISGSGIAVQHKIVFTGTENIFDVNVSGNYPYIIYYNTGVKPKAWTDVVCSHFVSHVGSDLPNVCYVTGNAIVLVFYPSVLNSYGYAKTTTTLISSAKAYLTAQNNANTPVTVVFQCITPQSIIGIRQNIFMSSTTNITNDLNSNIQISYTNLLNYISGLRR